MAVSCKGFRSTLERFAEWCSESGGKKESGGRKGYLLGTLRVPPLIPSLPVGHHHSAANEVGGGIPRYIS
ncbi:MAG: hypothetical protein J6T13_01125 [Bacteroidales bacterium]|nr:hypothetical protein [Bacteroidales bacterium]